MVDLGLGRRLHGPGPRDLAPALPGPLRHGGLQPERAVRRTALLRTRIGRRRARPARPDRARNSALVGAGGAGGAGPPHGRLRRRRGHRPGQRRAPRPEPRHGALGDRVPLSGAGDHHHPGLSALGPRAGVRGRDGAGGVARGLRPGRGADRARPGPTLHPGGEGAGHRGPDFLPAPRHTPSAPGARGRDPVPGQRRPGPARRAGLPPGLPERRDRAARRGPGRRLLRLQRPGQPARAGPAPGGRAHLHPAAPVRAGGDARAHDRGHGARLRAARRGLRGRARS